MFYAKDFDRVADLKIFEDFLRARGDDSPADFTYFPPTGVLIYHMDVPVCAGTPVVSLMIVRDAPKWSAR